MSELEITKSLWLPINIGKEDDYHERERKRQEPFINIDENMLPFKRK